jgi:hypothetical protein
VVPVHIQNEHLLGVRRPVAALVGDELAPLFYTSFVPATRHRAAAEKAATCRRTPRRGVFKSKNPENLVHFVL